MSLSIHSANLTVVASPTPPAYTVDVKFNPPATYDPEDASFPVWMRLEDTAQQDPDDEVTLFSYIHMMSAELTLSPTFLPSPEKTGLASEGKTPIVIHYHIMPDDAVYLFNSAYFNSYIRVYQTIGTQTYSRTWHITQNEGEIEWNGWYPGGERVFAGYPIRAHVSVGVEDLRPEVLYPNHLHHEFKEFGWTFSDLGTPPQDVIVDLDVDSDNTKDWQDFSGHGPDRDDFEDLLETYKPGRVVVLNDNDEDEDEAADLADGFSVRPGISKYDVNTSELDFVEMKITLTQPDDISPNSLFTFADSTGWSNLATELIGRGTIQPITPIALEDDYRVWNIPGYNHRTNGFVDNETGNLVRSNHDVTAEQLGIVDGNSSLWIEACQDKDNSGSEEIVVQYNHDGKVLSDTVCITTTACNLIALRPHSPPSFYRRTHTNGVEQYGNDWVFRLDTDVFRTLDGDPMTMETRYAVLARLEEQGYDSASPHIRLNGDDDDVDGIPDREEDGHSETAIVASDGRLESHDEDDMIRVHVLGGINIGLEYVLTRQRNNQNGHDLKIWKHPTKAGGTLIPDGEDSCVLNFDQNRTRLANADMDIYVEWVAPHHSDPDPNEYESNLTLSLMKKSDHTELYRDTLTFHTYHNLVVVFGGKGMPNDQGGNDVSYWDIGKNLYYDGYDVKMFTHLAVRGSEESDLDVTGCEGFYDEDTYEFTPGIPNGGSGEANKFVVQSVNERMVRTLVIIGYSWGGGSEYLLASKLANDRSHAMYGCPDEDPFHPEISCRPCIQIGPYDLVYTAYIDGVEKRYCGNPYNWDSLTWGILGGNIGQYCAYGDYPAETRIPPLPWDQEYDRHVSRSHTNYYELIGNNSWPSWWPGLGTSRFPRGGPVPGANPNADVNTSNVLGWNPFPQFPDRDPPGLDHMTIAENALIQSDIGTRTENSVPVR